MHRGDGSLLGGGVNMGEEQGKERCPYSADRAAPDCVTCFSSYQLRLWVTDYANADAAHLEVDTLCQFQSVQTQSTCLFSTIHLCIFLFNLAENKM